MVLLVVVALLAASATSAVTANTRCEVALRAIRCPASTSSHPERRSPPSAEQECITCAGLRQHALREADCSHEDIVGFCAAASAGAGGTAPVASCADMASLTLGADVKVLSAVSSFTGGGANRPPTPAGPLTAPCKAVVRSLCGAIAPAGCQQCVTHNAQKEIGAGCPTGAGAATEVIQYCQSLRASGELQQIQQRNVSYCLVKVLVQPAINIWVGLPSDGSYNGKFQAIGGGGYAGSVGAPTAAVLAGYVGAETDTGHVGGSGAFGMLRPGVPNMGLQDDFAFRSEHMMAVVSKQLIQAYYGAGPKWSYWNGCSTGGRQGLMMAQRFPADYNGILAGAPAIHWDKFQAYQIWPQLAMRLDAGGPIESHKQAAATAAAIAACDRLDGVTDGVIRDPRACNFSATSLVPSGQLTAGEATAIDKIWSGSRNAQGELMWYGIKPGASFQGLAGEKPFAIAIAQPRYWVYLNASWDWKTELTYANYAEFFDETVRKVEVPMGTDNADLRPFRDAGGKLIHWHGWADQLIMPQGSIDYYDQMETTVGGGPAAVREFARLFMAPGVAHCGMDTTPFFEALVRWTETGTAPDTLPASESLSRGRTRTRPLCPHPLVAVYQGHDSTDDATNFKCGQNIVNGRAVEDTENASWRANERVFGEPFVPAGF